MTAGTMAIAAFFASTAWFALTASMKSDFTEQNKLGASLMQLTLTHEMNEGNPEHISPYLEKVGSLPGVHHAHIVPSASVIQQFNIDASSFEPASHLEEEVFETRNPAQELLQGEKTLVHYALPYLASSAGNLNCLKCHDAGEGDVLGVVSLEFDVTDRIVSRNKTVIEILLLTLVFGILLAFALRKLITPLIETTLDIKQALARAEEGDFSVRLQKRSHDEAGDVAENTNHFMQMLENSFGLITREVESLKGKGDESTEENQLTRTVKVVQNMVRASHFKQSIENDRDLTEVYDRISRVLISQFKFKRFSLYEVSNSKNRMQLIAAHGLPDQADLWCSREILVDCTACRAQRTANLVSSRNDDQMCPSFAGDKIQDDEQFLHICLPLMLSGRVGGVLQVIYTESESAQIHGELSTLRSYIAEAAPVIEAKRLMQSLKDASMHDPMTGLYNRRFLEEYLDTLIAGVTRNKSDLGILMCDVDFFKKVNDTLGHDVGDAMLKAVAGILRQSVRESDLVIRYGGEEFVAILIGSNEEKTTEIAEGIRKTMEGHVFKTPQGPLSKTISIGIAFYPQDSNAFWECVKFADVAMYAAKESGRNKVTRFVPEMWKEGSDY